MFPLKCICCTQTHSMFSGQRPDHPIQALLVHTGNLLVTASLRGFPKLSIVTMIDDARQSPLLDKPSPADPSASEITHGWFRDLAARATYGGVLLLSFLDWDSRNFCPDDEHSD